MRINEALENLQEGKKRAARQRFEHVRWVGGWTQGARVRTPSFSPAISEPFLQLWFAE